MNRKRPKKLCPLCAGTKRTATTTFTADLEFGVVVVRRVPATVCSQCGADWIDDRVARQLENIVNDARKKTATGRSNLFQMSAMAYNAKKTEHAGAKKGRGAFYGRKAEAKKASNRRRREDHKRAALTNGASQA